MTRAVRLRLVAFVVLSAVGAFYASASLLGLTDRLLGNSYTVVAQLEGSGGLYEDSEVTYRGVPIGNVAEIEVTPDGAAAYLEIEEGFRIPEGTRAEVHNESAVGEQYIDLMPATSTGPYLTDGDTIPEQRTSLPLPEEKLLLHLDDFVNSVPREHLRTVIHELGRAFHGTSPELQRLIDGGNELVAAAHRNLEPTTRLIQDSQRVLLTQRQQAGNIATMARELADLTQTIREGDTDLRSVLRDGGGAARQVGDLVRRVRPTMPLMLQNLTAVNQVTRVNLAGLEQMLVLYPRAIASGFTGTDPRGYGHVNAQFAQAPPVCRKGFLPESQWRPPSDLTDGVLHDEVRCDEPLPIVPRGPAHAPDLNNSDSRASAGGSESANRPAPSFGIATGGTLVTPTGARVAVSAQGGQQELFGEESWRWLLIGPLTRR